jgi:hypothetical protein
MREHLGQSVGRAVSPSSVIHADLHPLAPTTSNTDFQSAGPEPTTSQSGMVVPSASLKARRKEFRSMPEIIVSLAAVRAPNAEYERLPGDPR